MEHLNKGDIIFPPYEFLVNNLFLPNVTLLAWVIIIGQVLCGISILAGAPNPSAFYIVIQVVLLLSNTGVILGFDKLLSHKLHYAFLIAQHEHKTIRPLAERYFFLILVFITFIGSIYSAFYIKDFNPNSIHDVGMILFVVGIISSAAFFIKYCYLIQHRIKFLIVYDDNDAIEVLEDYIKETFDIEVIKTTKVSKAQEMFVKDPNIVLIISDYNMNKNNEELNGGDLYLFIKGYKNLPFLLFSAEKVEDHDKLTNFHEDNIHNHILGKPFDKKRTEDRIEDILVYYWI